MAAAKQKLTIEQGTDWSQPLLWADGDGVVIDTSTYTARMDIREELESAEPLISLTTANGRITLGVVEETLGVPFYNILLQIENAATDDLPTGVWFYDLEMIAAGGTVKRLIYGRAKVTREVTRP